MKTKYMEPRSVLISLICNYQQGKCSSSTMDHPNDHTFDRTPVTGDIARTGGIIKRSSLGSAIHFFLDLFVIKCSVVDVWR